MNDKLGNIEWLSRTLSLKAQSYEIGSGKAEIDWTDKCGVFAKLNGEHLKAFASLLAWGDWKDSDMHFKTITSYLVHIALNALEKRAKDERKQVPQLRDSKHTTTDLFERLAKMVIYMHLRPVLQKVYPTIFGRLYFAGIEMDENAFRMTWKTYHSLMDECLNNWQAQIDHEIGKYRFELKKVAV